MQFRVKLGFLSSYLLVLLQLQTFLSPALMKVVKELCLGDLLAYAAAAGPAYAEYFGVDIHRTKPFPIFPPADDITNPHAEFHERLDKAIAKFDKGHSCLRDDPVFGPALFKLSENLNGPKKEKRDKNLDPAERLALRGGFVNMWCPCVPFFLFT